MVLYHKKPPRGFWGAIKFSPYSPPNRPLWEEVLVKYRHERNMREEIREIRDAILQL